MSNLARRLARIESASHGSAGYDSVKRYVIEGPPGYDTERAMAEVGYEHRDRQRHLPDDRPLP
jgi:hypothetical protein